MANKELLKSCRYYHGEIENPFEGVEQNKAMLWFYEQGWVKQAERGISPASADMLREYEGYGLKSFKSGDGIPLSLKALLFNRYARTAYSQADAVEPFKAFYEKYYN